MTMTETQIQSEVEALMDEMILIGLVNPECSAHIRAAEDPIIYMHWDSELAQYGRTELGTGETISEAILGAWKILKSIPAKEDRDRDEFAALLAKAIDKGRDIGIDVDFLNPLTETMKRISENALTYRGPDDQG